MTREELINELGFLDLVETPTVEVFILDQPILTENGIDCNIYKGRMHEDLPREITKTFYPKIKLILVKKDYELVEYNPAINPDRNIVWQYACEEVPFFNIIQQKLSTAPDEMEFYDSMILSYPDIWAIWVKFIIGNSNIFLLKKITPAKVINTGGKLALIFNQTIFQSLNENVLTIDGDFDVFSLNGILIFKNKTNFEKALLYEDIKRKVANEALNEIEAVDIVENFDELRSFLEDDNHSINKLNKLQEKEYFRHKTFSDYFSIIKDYNVPVTVDEVNKKFNVANKAEAKYLIKVLNDDYLKSELTT